MADAKAPKPRIAEKDWGLIAELHERTELPGQAKASQIIDNLAKLMATPDEWEWDIPGQLVFRHETALVIQIKRTEEPKQRYCNEQYRKVAFWIGDMEPFFIHYDIYVVRRFVTAMTRRLALKTMEHVGVLAALRA